MWFGFAGTIGARSHKRVPTRYSYACSIIRNGRAAAPPPGVNVKRILVSFGAAHATTGIGPHEISFSMRIAFNASCASMRSSLVAVGGSSGSRNS